MQTSIQGNIFPRYISVGRLNTSVGRLYISVGYLYEVYAEKFPNSRDRVLQELFIYKLSIPLHRLPLEDILKEWYKSHRSGYVKNQKQNKTLLRMMDEEN